MFNQQNRTTESSCNSTGFTNSHHRPFYLIMFKNNFEVAIQGGEQDLKGWLPWTVYDSLYYCGRWKGPDVTDKTFFVWERGSLDKLTVTQKRKVELTVWTQTLLETSREACTGWSHDLQMKTWKFSSPRWDLRKKYYLILGKSLPATLSQIPILK